jgi:D-alanyl-D-alanine carboxypeptidase
VTLGRPVVIVVLGSTREGRFKDVALLYELLRKSVR